MKLSKYQQEKRHKLKEKAFKLHKEGLNTREIGKALGRSRQWASDAIKLLSTPKEN